MEYPKKIFADFNNADTKGRVRLTTAGTLADLKTFGLKLEAGLELMLDDREGLSTAGIVEFSEEENIWVAKIDWERFNT